METEKFLVFLLSNFTKSNPMTKLLYATLTAAIILMSVTATEAFAQKDFTKIEGNDNIKNNPISQDILNKIENAKKEFELRKQLEEQRKEHQKLIDEQRRLAKQSLDQELKRMDRAYEEFTPRNAFERYVSDLNSTHHGIFWDQFNYLQAKISLAQDARDSVLDQGGSYVDAMKEYVKYAKMTKTEMINFIQTLNVKHNFAQEKTQSYFDSKGKLPRYENDLDAPCYDCSNKITKIKLVGDTVPVQNTIKPQANMVDVLRDKLSEMQQEFLDSKDVITQKTLVADMNKIVKQIHALK